MLFCPKCTENLHITDRQGIEIDFCPTCRGVWLDAGELEKIIERAIQTELQFSEGRGTPSGGLSDVVRQGLEGKGKKKDKKKYGKEYKKKFKKKHVLEEIFDIFD